jgi:hypothetical protein
MGSPPYPPRDEDPASLVLHRHWKAVAGPLSILVATTVVAYILATNLPFSASVSPFGAGTIWWFGIGIIAVLVLLVRQIGCLLTGIVCFGYFVLSAGLAPTAGAQSALLVPIVAVAVVIVARWTVRPLLALPGSTCVVTLGSVIVRWGLLQRGSVAIPLMMITNVSFAQHGPLDRTLGTGTLLIGSPATPGVIALRDCPRVEQTQREMVRLIAAARR